MAKSPYNMIPLEPCKYKDQCEGYHEANVTCHEQVASEYCMIYKQFEKQIHEVKGFK